MTNREYLLQCSEQLCGILEAIGQGRVASENLVETLLDAGQLFDELKTAYHNDRMERYGWDPYEELQ